MLGESMASIRPRLIAVENTAVNAAGIQYKVASIRPRLIAVENS